MRYETIRNAETQLSRTISGLRNIGLDNDALTALRDAEQVIQEVRHFACLMVEIPSIDADRLKAEVQEHESRLIDFIRYGLWSKPTTKGK